jgi:ParB family transcriptional regulator, chromosome partitioning protein
MELEFHQLDLGYEHLRLRRPERQRRLLASLASLGQQVPIVVVVVPNQPGRYLVIDGYKRVAALRQLGRDTVQATVWQMNEADALVLDRSMRASEGETALEQGWLLVELGRRFGYSLDELARRFDRSASWVSRRLALVELLPESVQEQVRRGEISAHVAMKFLVPAARVSLEDCRRLADGFAAHRFNTREAEELYAAWRDASPCVRRRVLEEPKLFLKAQREAGGQQTTASAGAELSRDLEMILTIANRAGRRSLRAVPLMDDKELDQARHTLDRALNDLKRLAQRIKKENPDVKQESTDSDSRTACPGSEKAGDCASPPNLPPVGPPGYPIELVRSAQPRPSRESRTLPQPDPGAACGLQRESGPSP